MSRPVDGSFDVAIVGAGIVGLAHAWMAARQGRRVGVFERSSWAQGASIRNFGMIWPVGQPAGHEFQTALRSRELWLELAETSDIVAVACGSIHLAHRQDELQVLEEFRDRARTDSAGFQVRMLSPAEVMQRTRGANPDGLLGGMWSDTELCVDPRNAIRMMPGWLSEQHGVETHFDTQIVSAEDGRVTASDGRSWQADRIVVCGGSDFETLFPETFAESGLKRCKLQMMRTDPQRDGWRLGPHLASGLTLRHYTSFEVCPSLSVLKERIAAETPELDRYGIHVMAGQNSHGEVILGDSHEYDEDIAPFDRAEIDALILRELRKLIALPDWTIVERWHGVYAKCSDAAVFEAEPVPGVHVVTGTGGAGMTMSFGLADEHWRNWGDIDGVS